MFDAFTDYPITQLGDIENERHQFVSVKSLLMTGISMQMLWYSFKMQMGMRE
jgi:hypothetical protein